MTNDFLPISFMFVHMYRKKQNIRLTCLAFLKLITGKTMVVVPVVTDELICDAEILIGCRRGAFVMGLTADKFCSLSASARKETK